MSKIEESSLKKIFWMLFSLLLAAFTVWAILRESKTLSISQLFKVVIGGNPLYLAIAVICAAGYVFFEAVAICSILKGINYKKKIHEGIIYSTADVYFSAITPSATGGQPASAYFMHEDGIPTGVVSATLILNLMMYTCAIGFLGIISIIMNPDFFREFGSVARIFICVGFVILIALTYFFYLLLKKSKSVFDFIRKVLTFLKSKNIFKVKDQVFSKLDKTQADYENCAKMFAGKSRILSKAFIFNVLQRASQIAVPMFMYLCLGGNKSNMITLFSKQSLVTIGYNFIPIPGAMGISDFLMIDGFSKIMTHEAAMQLDMVSRAISFYFCVTISGLITLGGYLWKKKKR
ncbi:lysylphosphatidylglycerol synthase transmembrane domain-containing protein [Butyrivibrio sp. AE3004]|uniref:lysylphosphatidylglycerol synthase transmembrane domain-containing protein n=1 Tax=Butyrivibrio sp. AE3004 TaxID=1506994 RepID=UPI0009DEFCC9|nr:lysylphosphatidylglycerol synthase transmembrane domain-containing protein [Butyrivibrio sp. AE3004]